MKFLKVISKLTWAFGFILGVISCGDTAITPGPQLNVVSPPNPNVFPVFLMMQDHPELNINLITTPGGSGVPPYFESGEGDIATIYSYVMAEHVISGSIPDMQLRAVTLWTNFYLVSENTITSLSDLLGKTIIITSPSGTGKNGAAFKIMQAAILRAGYQLTDFNLTYELLYDGMDKVAAGEADAILLAEPAATGFIAKSFFQNNKLSKTVSLQDILSGYSNWAEGQLPLGGVATLSHYDTQEKAQAVENFVQAYKEAATKIMEHKMAAAATISDGLKNHYNIEMPWPIISRSINEGTLTFNTSKSIKDIQPELNGFITELAGPLPTDDFYKD